jgi:hypothetical protein
MKGLINRKAVKGYAIKVAAERHHRFTRVGGARQGRKLPPAVHPGACQSPSIQGSHNKMRLEQTKKVSAPHGAGIFLAVRS